MSNKLMENSSRYEVQPNNGLSCKHQQLITEIVSLENHVQSAWLFGSRAIGSFKPNSDIDLVLVGEALTLSDLANILSALDQTTIPYKVDVLIKHQITNDALLKHIDEFGVLWFEREAEII